MNKKIIAVSVLIAILFVSSIAGTIFYYNGLVNDGDSKIAKLNTQIAGQNSQISNLNSQLVNLTGQLTNVTSTNLVTALGITEIAGNNRLYNGATQLYNHLLIDGTVTNTGEGAAFNAGLHVVAYAADGTLEINMTVPLDNNYSVFGTDSATDIYGSSSLQLGNLVGGQIAGVFLGIYHEGTVTNWTVTPVWTNSP